MVTKVLPVAYRDSCRTPRAYVNVHVLGYLKKEVAWAINRQLQVISNKMLLYRGGATSQVGQVFT